MSDTDGLREVLAHLEGPKRTPRFQVGDRVLWLTRNQPATVIRTYSVDAKPWQRGEVKIQVDGDPVPVDTREVFLRSLA